MANDYSVGNLGLQLTGSAGQALNSIDKVIKRLEKVSAILSTLNQNSVNLSNISSGMTNLFGGFSDDVNIKAINAIGKIPNIINKVNGIDFDKAKQGFTSLANSIQPFINKVNSAEKSLTALDSVLSKKSIWSGKSGGSKGVFSQISSVLNFGQIAGKIYAAARFGRMLANALATAVQYASDYNETLNLWQVAMRENVELAEEFVNKINKAYGISQEAAMKYQATFKNMLATLGALPEATTYKLSEYLTQMSLDYASLYNQTIESAMQKFQAVLAGQVRPIRSVSGYDITQNTYYELYQQLGGTKTMRNLSEIEKRLLRILAVQKQMSASGAIGDMAKTINQFANQSRMMVELWKETAQWIGTIVKLLLDENEVLIKINAALIVAREIFKEIAARLGYEETDFLSGMFENVTETSDAIDELQGKLFDFDRFRTMSDSSDDSTLGIDEKLLQALSGYDSIIDDVNNKANELAQTWLGMLPPIDEIIQDLKFIGILLLSLFGAKLAFDIGKFFSNPLNIALSAAILGIGALALGIYDLIKNGATYKSLLLIAAGITAIGIAISIVTGSWIPLLVAAIVAAVTALAIHIYMVRDKIVDAFNDVKEWFENTWDTASTWFKNIGITIKNWFSNTWTDIKTGANIAFKYLGELHSTLWKEFANGFANVINSIANGFITFVNWCAEAINTLLYPINELSEFLGGKSIVIKQIEYRANWKPYSDFKDGGYPDKGTIFRAGENGAEVVYNSNSGRTGVANMTELEEATYRALIRANYDNKQMGTSNKGGSDIVINIGGNTFVRIVKEELAKQGLKVVKV